MRRDVHVFGEPLRVRAVMALEGLCQERLGTAWPTRRQLLRAGFTKADLLAQPNSGPAVVKEVAKAFRKHDIPLRAT